MNDYKVTIGLEVHAELKTRTKMFCDSPNDPEEKEPNVNICPVCMAHPGTLPVINKEAVTAVVRVGKALGGSIANFTEFDRKNYFYPDIPKGYQISQYKYPIVSGGTLNGVSITRVHLEEDTARSTHDKGEYSLVDFNRAGVPLMELVTEPVITNAKQAGDFARELQILLRYLGASEANMEKGQMRVEANISVSKTGEKGTKVEVKNLNSFRSVERAIEYETKRQAELLEEGGVVAQETRGWDEKKQETFSQRKKESSHDYRYFPDPDLPKLHLNEASFIDEIDLPELPWEKRERYSKKYGIKSEDIELYVSNPHIASFFEAVCAEFGENPKLVQLASNYISSDLVGLEQTLGDRVWSMSALSFAELVVMTGEGAISSRGAKEILKILVEKGGNPKDIAEAEGLFQKSDEGEIQKIAEAIIEKNPNVVLDYRNGKVAALKFLVGQGMKESKGSANPTILEALFTKLLS